MKNYTDQEIENLIVCPKRIKTPPKKELWLERGHLRNDMDLISTDEQYEFSAFIRINRDFEENFSIGLTYLPKDGTGSLHLLRLNGPHGPHSNHFLETNHHVGYHVHKAKTQNISEGLSAELYAELTSEYASHQEALVYFIKRVNIQDAAEYFQKLQQMNLF